MMIPDTDILQVNKIFTSPVKLKNFLKENSIYLKKYLGQNFLVDYNIIKKIIDSMGFKSDDIILEIGAGIGNVTIFYIQNIKFAILIEKDKGLVKILNKIIPEDKAKILHTDFLKIDLNKLLLNNFRPKLFSNLPYNVASQIIFKIIDNINFFDEIYLMVPEILFEKMRASSGSKNWTRFSVYFQTFAKAYKLFKVGRNSFFPIPEIDSVFLKIVKLNEPLIPFEKKEDFKNFLKLFFSKRRKKLKNIIKDEEKFEIDLNKRPEDIEIQEIIKIFNLKT